MSFATEEARKQAEKGARYAMVEDDTVFGWAVHYFEEDSIEGTLYNEDGTEYKAPMPKVTAAEQAAEGLHVLARFTHRSVCGAKGDRGSQQKTGTHAEVFRSCRKISALAA